MGFHLPTRIGEQYPSSEWWPHSPIHPPQNYRIPSVPTTYVPRLEYVAKERPLASRWQYGVPFADWLCSLGKHLILALGYVWYAHSMPITIYPLFSCFKGGFGTFLKYVLRASMSIVVCMYVCSKRAACRAGNARAAGLASGLHQATPGAARFYRAFATGRRKPRFFWDSSQKRKEVCTFLGSSLGWSPWLGIQQCTNMYRLLLWVH